MPLIDWGAMRHARVCDSYIGYWLLWYFIVDDFNKYDGYGISVVPTTTLKMLRVRIVMMIKIAVVVMIFVCGHQCGCK